ncbi:hypothetical protein TELCIR_11301 [Teladorsagia circumcincta]|uniref:Uncharacterized protein n=1 Tax=Teladorsagia circumcincta TaxID=45464 RepID=A0A2G9U9R2_TELCI|nr:hypothetical protein TELCIR_11301 [Teladorsagia circumcincta]
MHDFPSPSNFKDRSRVKVPKTKEENRILKQGYTDHNNDHLAYFNFRIIWPTLALTISVYAFFISEYDYCSSMFDKGVSGLKSVLWARSSRMIFQIPSSSEEPSGRVMDRSGFDVTSINNQ